MALELFSDDVEVISKLGDDPNIDDNLSADDLKAKFDDGPRLIKKFINEFLIPAVNEKLPSAELDSAINKAMKTAKESGAFDGGYYKPNVSESHNFPNGERTMNLAFDFFPSNDSLEEVKTVHVSIPIGNTAYFASLPEAIEAINSNSNAAWPKPINAEDTSVGVVKIAGQWLVTLYADMQITERLLFRTDATLNLNGHTITLVGDAFIGFAPGTDSAINGGTGKIVKALTDDMSGQQYCILASGNSFTLQGGSYEMSGECSQNVFGYVVVGSGEKLTMNGAKIVADNAGTSSMTGVSAQGKSAVLRGCEIYVNCSKGAAQGVLNTGDTEIRDCNIFADAGNQTVGEYNGMESYSYGISNRATLHVYNSRIYGTHSGMLANSASKTYIAGCTMESPSHGGAYICTGPDGIFYAVDSTFRCDYYKGKNDVSLFTTGVAAGFYVGGTSGTVAYMDRCAMYCSGKNPFVLRGTDGETDLELYLSNCTISGDGNTVRIDDGAGHAYIGAGCNISTATPGVDTDKVTFTGEIYRKIYGDWGQHQQGDDAVRYGTQALTAELRAQARDNIDAGSAIIAEATGSAIALTDASGRPLRGLTIYGKTEQFKTTGAQLLDLSGAASSGNGLTATFDDDSGILTINGTTSADGNTVIKSGFELPTMTADERYCLSVTKVSGSVTFPNDESYTGMKQILWSLFSSDNSQFANNRLSQTSDIAAGGCKATTFTGFVANTGKYTFYLQCYYGGGVVFDNYKVRVQLQEGLHVTDWEPYTGGTAAPNPSYPQALVSAGAGNIFTQGLISGWINTANGAMNNDARSVRSADYTPVQGGKEITISNDRGYYVYVFEYDANKSFLRYSRNMNADPYTVLLGDDARYIMIRSDQGTIQNDLSAQYQIKYTDPAEAVIPISIGDQLMFIPAPGGLPGIPVTSGGNYTDENGQRWICDEIDLGGGVYVQRIRTREFTGAETWTLASVGLTYERAWVLLEDAAPRSQPMCNMCPGIDPLDAAQGWNGTEMVSAITAEQYIYVYRPTKQLPDVNSTAAWKAWLAEQYAAGTPFVVAYALAEPVETALDAETLAVYAALHTNKPNTTITNDAGAGMKVEYVADTKAYIDNKFAAVIAAMMA